MKQIVVLSARDCLTAKEIAAALDLSEGYIKHYRRHTYDILGIWTLAELCRYYWTHVEEFPDEV